MAQTEKLQPHHLIRIFKPSRAEVIGLLLISSQILIIVNLLPAIKQVESINIHSFSDYLSHMSEKLLAPLGSNLATTVLTYILWMSVGVCVYLIYWFIVINAKAYKADLPPSVRSIIPKGTDKRSLWHQALARISVRFLASLGFIFWLYVVFSKILPYTAKLFLLGVGAGLPEIFYFIPLSIAALATSMFMFIAILRLVFLRERVF